MPATPHRPAPTTTRGPARAGPIARPRTYEQPSPATWLTHVETDHASPFEQATIRAVSPHRRFVTYDARGCGLSQRNVDEVSMDAWLRDLEAVVDDQGLERFPLLGISQGAAIAVAYAARHPERVSQLVLLGGFATSYLSAAKAEPRIVEEAETLITFRTMARARCW